MGIFEYNGYVGIVEIDTEEGLLHGRIHGINDLVTFEAESVSEIKKEFQNAVDDYLEFCKMVGKEPDKTYKGQFNVRISPELHKKIVLQAAKEGVTLNKFVEVSLVSYVDKVANENFVVEKLNGIEDKVEECVKAFNSRENKKTWDGYKTTNLSKDVVNIELYRQKRVVS